MKKIILLIALSSLMVMCKTEKRKSEEVRPKVENKVSKSEIVVYNDFETFQKEVLNVAQTQPTIINFWATWCKPCVEEMPMFIELMNNKKYADVKFIFVSMDFKKDIETKLRKYITEKNILSNTVVLLAAKPNQWIDKVSKDWTGALPFTMVIKGNKRATHNGKIHSKKEIIELLESVGK